MRCWDGFQRNPERRKEGEEGIRIRNLRKEGRKPAERGREGVEEQGRETKKKPRKEEIWRGKKKEAEERGKKPGNEDGETKEAKTRK
jgi:hypothetical protein